CPRGQTAWAGRLFTAKSFADSLRTRWPLTSPNRTVLLAVANGFWGRSGRLLQLDVALFYQLFALLSLFRQIVLQFLRRSADGFGANRLQRGDDLGICQCLAHRGV